MWNGWVAKESLIKAAKRVGLHSGGLSVKNMQQDKMAQAASCMQQTVTESEPKESVISSPKDVRKNSWGYWKRKYDDLQQSISLNNKGSVHLDEVQSGLLTVEKVRKPKLSGKSTRVAQIFGSMEGQDVLTLVENIKDQKLKKVDGKEKLLSKKQLENENFYMCKEKCVCDGKTCVAYGLKECPSCYNI